MRIRALSIGDVVACSRQPSIQIVQASAIFKQAIPLDCKCRAKIGAVGRAGLQHLLRKAS